MQIKLISTINVHDKEVSEQQRILKDTIDGKESNTEYIFLLRRTDNSYITVGDINKLGGLCDDCNIYHHWHDFFTSDGNRKLNTIETYQLTLDH